MTELSQEQKLIAGLCEAYGQKPSAARVRLYLRALSDLSYEELRDACARVVRESTFFPSVAELRRHVEPATDDSALLAWSAVQQAASQVGSYSSLLLEDGAAAAALVAVFGSWPEFCGRSDIEMATRQKEFMAAYRQARRGATGTVRLQGTCELSGNYNVSQNVWVGVITAAGDVRSLRDTEAEKMLAEKPRRGILLGAQKRIGQ